LSGVFSSQNKGFAHSVEEAEFTFDPCELHILEEGPGTSTTLTRKHALEYYHQLVTIRRMETAAGNMYKEKAIRGFCHLCSGQEAIYVGMKAALRETVS
jgi:pyruvate dehydrogenase E1 component alpha subunit